MLILKPHYNFLIGSLHVKYSADFCLRTKVWQKKGVFIVHANAVVRQAAVLARMFQNLNCVVNEFRFGPSI